MPPYFDFHLKKVALLMPCLRHTSAVLHPGLLLPQDPDDLLFREPGFASSSVSLQGAGLYLNLEECSGAQVSLQRGPFSTPKHNHMREHIFLHAVTA